MTDDRDMWLKDNIKHNDALGRQLSRANRAESRVKKLHEVLQAASDHLDYTGYGDTWERECANAEKLPERIAEILKEKP